MHLINETSNLNFLFISFVIEKKLYEYHKRNWSDIDGLYTRRLFPLFPLQDAAPFIYLFQLKSLVWESTMDLECFHVIRSTDMAGNAERTRMRFVFWSWYHAETHNPQNTSMSPYYFLKPDKLFSLENFRETMGFR